MQRYYDYGTYLKQKYGQKVYKLPVNLPVSCPQPGRPARPRRLHLLCGCQAPGI